MSQMFSPSLQDGNNTSHSMDVDNSVVSSYLHSLRPVDLSEIPLLELLHTLFKNTAVATADALDQYIDVAKRVTGYYATPQAPSLSAMRRRSVTGSLCYGRLRDPWTTPPRPRWFAEGATGFSSRLRAPSFPWLLLLLTATATPGDTEAPARSTCTWHWSMP
jgi:hypothetical protein